MPGSFTVEFWFRLAGGDDRESASIVRCELFSLVVRQKKPYAFDYRKGGGHATASLHEETGELEPERWYHFAVVRDTERRVLFYLDGERLTMESSIELPDLTTKLGVVHLGGRGRDFRGRFDEFRVYDYARDAASIAEAAAR